MTQHSAKRHLSDAQTVSRIEKVADALDIPKEFLAGTLKVTIIGNSELFLEGKLTVIEYTETFLSVSSSGYILTLSGADFEVKELETDYMHFTGKLTSLGYIF